MESIGDYNWPTKVTFDETLRVTEAAVKNYGDIIPIIEATKLLGYNFASAASIPGYVYKRLDELTTFGLVQRDKVNRGLRATELGKRAFADYEVEAIQARIQAIKSVPIIERAFTAWKGKIPPDTAFASELAKLTDRPRNEVEKHVDSLKKLISECFPLLQPSGQPAPLTTTAPRREMAVGADRRDTRLVDTMGSKPASEGGQYGELRTTMGSVNIVDENTLVIAEAILKGFRSYFDASTTTTTTPKKEKTNAKPAEL